MADLSKVVRADATEGTSPKTKLVASISSFVGAVVVLLAIVFPDALTSQAQAAIIAVVMAGAGVWAAWKGEPGNVVVESFPLDDTPSLDHNPEDVVAEVPPEGP